jgi:RecJ-like exonuclease
MLMTLPALLLCTACGKTLPGPMAFLDPTAAVPINSLKPEATASKVVVEGKVQTVAPMLGQAAYEVKDGTGTIWVFTQGNAPPKDAQVKIYGTLRQAQGELYVEQQ